MELNPVRANMVDDPMKYQWSSYQAYANGKKDVILDEHPVYLQLSEDKGERKKKYREFVRGMLKVKEAMKGEMNSRVLYGSEGFVGKITGKYKIQELIKPKGRQIGWRKK